MFKARFLLVLLPFSFGVFAQDVNPSVWTLHNGRYDLNERFYLHSEVHFRFTDGLATFQQFLFRPQLSFIQNDHLIFSAGYTYIHNYPYGEISIPDDAAENNLWEEAIINHAIKRLHFSHRLRLEHRWADRLVQKDGGWEKDGTQFSNRFRYRLTLQFPLNDRWTLIAYDEFFTPVSFEDFEFNINQNWLFVGAKYQLNPAWSIQSGYQQQYLSYGDQGTQQNPTWMIVVNYRLERN
jgi:long-subunit fatty acid transport protein